jgi:polysaccharide biosynthesis transport protein
MEEFEFSDYVYILRRWRKLFFLVSGIIFLSGLIIALQWSNYRATATLAIAPPEVSSNATIPAGMNAVNYTESLADSRISYLQQQALLTSSLSAIINSFNLYPELRKKMSLSAIADMMRKKVKLETVSTSDQKTTSSDPSTVEFNISFEYTQALGAQQAVAALVAKLLEIDLQLRRKVAHETSVFLDSQIKALESTMLEQEKKIAAFRASNSNTQPESLAFNQQAAESTLFNIQNIDTQLAANEGIQGNLRAQLAVTEPYTRVIADGQVLTTPKIQLKAMKAQYTTLSSQYGQAYPDVVKLKHQIEALEKHVGPQRIDTAELEAQISDIRTNLAATQKIYGSEHPDVISLQHQLEHFKRELDHARTPTYRAEEPLIRDADNPAYLQFVAQLKSTQEQYKALRIAKDSLMAQKMKYQGAIAANPLVEQKIASLSRDYENAQQRYRSLKEKKMAAEMNEMIEHDRNGQRLVVLNPPPLPSQTQPARSLFVIGGLALGLIAGLASVIIAQAVSQSIVGPHHLELLLGGVAPLVTIPHLSLSSEKKAGFAGIKKGLNNMNIDQD